MTDEVLNKINARSDREEPERPWLTSVLDYKQLRALYVLEIGTRNSGPG